MSRVGGSSKYFFSSDYYAQLGRGLGENLSIAEVRREDGTVAACALVMVHRGRVHYHLAGSTSEGAVMGANNLLVWTIIKWAAEHGKDTVHLGGGVSADDSLFRFKKSFGGHRAEFWTGAHVINPEKYAELTAARAHRLGVSTQTLMSSQFFPAHRLESISV
jgi:lipid II:glycine glycyltransferase (peptidoglycan interpeptide bridge formation enzyme)